jgi:predicted nucleotidyltransferase
MYQGPENEWRADPLEMVAPANLQVLSFHWSPGYGRQALFRYKNEKGEWIRRTFNHLEEFPDHIKPGQFVASGERFVRMGKTGKVTGIHLHDEMWQETKAEKDYLDRYSERAAEYAKYRGVAAKVYAAREKSTIYGKALQGRKELERLKGLPGYDVDAFVRGTTPFEKRQKLEAKLKKNEKVWEIYKDDKKFPDKDIKKKYRRAGQHLRGRAKELFNSDKSDRQIKYLRRPATLHSIASAKKATGSIKGALAASEERERIRAALAAARAEEEALAGQLKESTLKENTLKTEGCGPTHKKKIKIKIRPGGGKLITSFEVQPNLNSTVWEGDTLRPDILERLREIAEEFITKLDLPNVDIKDIILTGSLANYNWSKYSDLDVHIVVDFRDVAEDEGFVKKYFDAVRANWNRNHDIKVKGFEVELYVEDDDESHESTGIYSLLTDEWILKPVREHTEIDKVNIFKKARHIMRDIDKVERYLDRSQYDAALELGQKTKDKIKKMRRSGLQSGGIYSTENLAFKVLRRGGYMGKLLDSVGTAYDAQRSLAEQE